MKEKERPCDGGGPHSYSAERRVLPLSPLSTSGGGNAILCRSCYMSEIDTRTSEVVQNRARYTWEEIQKIIPKWSDLPLYYEK